MALSSSANGGSEGRVRIARLGAARYLLLLLLFPVLLWPAAINGGPILFADTTAYIRGPDAIVARLTGHRSIWTQAVPEAPGAPTLAITTSEPTATASMAVPEEKPILLGRSIYYGALAYLGAMTSPWITILVQALIAWACALGLLRHIVSPAHPRRFGKAALLMLGALAVSPLPFFASFLMPDLFTGCAMLAAAALLGGWDRESRGARIAWIAMATFAALCHASHILILLLLASATAGLVLLRRIIARQATSSWQLSGAGAVAIATAALLGLAGDAAFTTAVRHATGRDPIRPPFVTARLVADGFAGPFLARNCSVERQPYVLCRYADRMPATPFRPWSDGFLWSKDGRSGGVFMAVPVADQRALSAEQGRFALHVFLERPVDLSLEALEATAEQSGMLRLDEFNYSAQERANMARRLPAPVFREAQASAAYHGAMPTRAVQLLAWLTSGAALLAIVAALRLGRPAGLGRYTLVVAAAWLANAAVCGALSTPHHRYNMRAIWPLLVLGAGAAVARPFGRRQPDAA